MPAISETRGPMLSCRFMRNSDFAYEGINHHGRPQLRSHSMNACQHVRALIAPVQTPVCTVTHCGGYSLGALSFASLSVRLVAMAFSTAWGSVGFCNSSTSASWR